MGNTRREVVAALLALAGAGAVPAWARGIGAHGADANPDAKRKPVRLPLGAGAAFDGQGRLWVAQLEAAQQADGAPASFNIVLSWSADGGQAWTRVGPVLDVPEAVEANGEGRPKLVFGPGGQLYLTFTSPLSKPHTGNIRFVRSTDGGRSFSAPVTVQRDLAVTGHRFDSIIVDREGRIFIAWIDKRDLDAARAAKRPYRGAAIYYTVSTDNGASFGPDIKAADHCCECCRISLALSPDGVVFAIWRHIFEPNVRDHALAPLSPLGKVQAITRVSFDDWRIDACPHHGPSLAFDGDGRRHQVWFSGAGEDGGLFYAAAAQGARPGPAQRLGGTLAEHGEVAAAGRSVVVTWKEFDGQATRVMARLSTDGGASWRERELAATRAASDHPHLASIGGAIALVWRTENEGFIVRKVEV